MNETTSTRSDDLDTAGASLIHRSVALPDNVDRLLEDLAQREHTSRSHLFREGLTLLFRSRGLDVNAHQTVRTNGRAVERAREAKQSPGIEQARDRLDQWWSANSERVEVEHPDLAVSELLTMLSDGMDRRGRYRANFVEICTVPDGFDHQRHATLWGALRLLASEGVLEHRRVRGTDLHVLTVSK